MSEYSEYSLAPKFVVVMRHGIKVQSVFGPFGTREDAQASADSQGHAFEVLKLTAPVQKKQPVTVVYERSDGNTNAVNTLARDLGVAWSEGADPGAASYP